jgi:hypothetical protein
LDVAFEVAWREVTNTPSVDDARSDLTRAD